MRFFIMEKPYYLYIIQSECGHYYVGISEEIEYRINQHNEGVSKWTSRYKGWHLVYSERYENLSKARQRENQIKRMKGGEGFKRLIAHLSGS